MIGETCETYQMQNDRCWVDKDNISISIVKTDEGFIIDVYPSGYEDLIESLASIGILHQEVEDAILEFEESDTPNIKDHFE